MNRKALTLIEILVVMVILGVVVTTLYFAFTRSMYAWQRANQKLEAYQNARSAIDLMSRDLASAVAVPGKDAFYGAPNVMIFTAMIDGELKEVTLDIRGDVFTISYNACDFNLEKPAAGAASSGSFLYGDSGDAWWTTTGASGGNPRQNLPKIVKVAFSLVSGGYKEDGFKTTIYLPNSE